MRGVRQVLQRSPQAQRQFTVAGNADGFVAPALTRLAVGFNEPAGRFPLIAPLLLGEPGLGQVVACA
jgi:hypothetical protein